MSDIADHWSQPELKRLFNYSPRTGLAHWRRRSGSWYLGSTDRVREVWNEKYAGKPVGILDVSGYLRCSLFNCSHPLHRLIWIWMTGTPPSGEIDHLDHNRANNRWANLREVPLQANRQNKLVYRNNVSGYHGIFKHGDKWRARITVAGKVIHLGTFTSFEDAVAARKTAEMQYGFHRNHGVFFGI